jgi:hypothetical protein
MHDCCFISRVSLIDLERQRPRDGRYTRAVFGQRLDKHVLGATDTHATEERCFQRGPCRDVISKGQG